MFNEIYNSPDPVILTFNGFFWKGFENGLECLKFLTSLDTRDFFTVVLNVVYPF